MATETGILSSSKSESPAQLQIQTLPTNENAKLKDKLYAAVFLASVTGFSILAGFGGSLAAARKRDPKSFGEGLIGVKGIPETGASLALRALGWGTLYAVSGCSIICYGIWKISGASNFHEFRLKMGSLLPRIPKNDPPQSRTEFKNLTDILTYISEDWGKKED